MWILAKHSRSQLSRAQLESLLVQRTIALEKLSQRLLRLQDEERRRIARDLHDATGQTLVAIKMSVADLDHRLQNNLCTSGVLSDISVLAEQALQEIRTMSYLLHPPLLDEIGFSAAAKWYVDGFAQRSGISASLELAAESGRLPITIETALFRILQEGLTNVHRYSGSSKVSIRFQRQAETVVLEIADCGCGIPAELLKRLGEGSVNTGVGLAGMRERLHELGGELEINSNRFGTMLRAIVPLFARDQPAWCLVYGPPVDFSQAAHSSANSASYE